MAPPNQQQLWAQQVANAMTANNSVKAILANSTFSHDPTTLLNAAAGSDVNNTLNDIFGIFNEALEHHGQEAQAQ